jgi:hypothetical protein
MNTTVKTPPRKPGRPAQGRPPESRQARQASPAGPSRLGRPVRPRRSARPPRPADKSRPAEKSGLGRLGGLGGLKTAPARSRAAGAARDLHAAQRRPTSRTPFILLLLGLLGGGLVCLLVINTTLAAASYRIDNLQRSNAAATQQVQDLQQQVASEQSPGSIEQRALKLGMRPQQVLNFVDLKTGRRYTMPSRAQGAYAVPGYTP